MTEWDLPATGPVFHDSEQAFYSIDINTRDELVGVMNEGYCRL